MVPEGQGLKLRQGLQGDGVLHCWSLAIPKDISGPLPQRGLRSPCGSDIRTKATQEKKVLGQALTPIIVRSSFAFEIVDVVAPVYIVQVDVFVQTYQIDCMEAQTSELCRLTPHAHSLQRCI